MPPSIFKHFLYADGPPTMVMSPQWRITSVLAVGCRSGREESSTNSKPCVSERTRKRLDIVVDIVARLNVFRGEMGIIDNVRSELRQCM
jgi:hypothetical protein